MKQLLQQVGVRKWFGDEWIIIQNELMEVLESYFGMYNQQFVIAGCQLDGLNIEAGLVCLKHGDAFKICRFDGAENVTLPVYLKVEEQTENRLYQDGESKPVSIEYKAVISPTNDNDYLVINEGGLISKFVDVIQDETHSFVTEDEKTNYASQASTAISVIRDGIASNLNTLEKLRSHIQNQYDNLPEAIGVDEIYATIRGGVAENFNTLKLLYDYIGSLEYLPEFRGRSALTNNTIDWTGKPERFMSTTSNITLDASNLVIGKTIGLLVTGNYDVYFNSKFKKILTSPSFDKTKTNYIQMKCLKSDEGDELIIYSISFIL